MFYIQIRNYIIAATVINVSIILRVIIWSLKTMVI